MADGQDTVGAGAAGFGTTVEEMARAGRHVLDVDAEVQADLAALRGQLAPLQGAWVGEAATTFAGLMARWDADARCAERGAARHRRGDPGLGSHLPAAGGGPVRRAVGHPRGAGLSAGGGGAIDG